MKRQIRKGGGEKQGGGHGGFAAENKFMGKPLAEKPIAAERTLSTRLDELGKEFKAMVGFEKFSGNPNYSGAVKTLWQIALADKKQEGACMDAVKEALKNVVLQETPWLRILFYVTLRSISLPVDSSGGLKQKHGIFSFLMGAEKAQEPADQFVLNVLVDCMDSLLMDMHSGFGGQGETIN